MSVIDMAQWASERGGDPALKCACGSEWFELQDGAVTLNHERSVTGYAGTIVCMECGREN